MDAQKRRMYCAMLDSLSGSFSNADKGAPLVISLNAGDVAEMLRDLSVEITPRPTDAIGVRMDGTVGKIHTQ